MRNDEVNLANDKIVVYKARSCLGCLATLVLFGAAVGAAYGAMIGMADFVKGLFS